MTPTTVFYIRIADDANQIALLLRPCSLIFLPFIWKKKIKKYGSFLPNFSPQSF